MTSSVSFEEKNKHLHTIILGVVSSGVGVGCIVVGGRVAAMVQCQLVVVVGGSQPQPLAARQRQRGVVAAARRAGTNGDGGNGVVHGQASS